MNIDQLIRDADPAADFTIPGHDSPLALESFERRLAAAPRRKHVRRLWLTLPASLTAVAAAAAAITLIVTITPGVPVSPAAAAVLNQAAAAAGRQKPLVLGPGEYLYTETRSLSDATVVVGNNGSGGVYYPEYVYTDQSWLTQQGAGKEVRIVVSPVTFAHGTRRVWIEAGKPKIYDHNPTVVLLTGGESESSTTSQPYTGLPLDNLAHLPTDPAALARDIEHHKTGLADINADVDAPSSPAGIFYAAMLILSDKSVGGTPALRSALFKVMAEQPGIKLLGRTRTRSGRTGIGLQTPPDRDGNFVKVIIDPASGQVLEYDDYSHRVAVQWTEYLSTAVVKKIGQLPHG
jgi:hypothetical protein